MKKLRLLLLSIALFMSSSCLYAQDDSAFAQIYRTLREMTDSLKTYSLYIVPPQSADKIKLGTLYQRRLAEVFHFLKSGKQVNYENPDFIIGFLVDGQSLHTPNGTASTSYSAGINGTINVLQATHKFHFTVLIHTKKKQQFSFRLGGTVYVSKRITETPSYSFNNQIKDSITKNRLPQNQGYLLRDQSISQNNSFLDSRLLPDVEDYKTQLLKVFQLFKNKYVDRVYN